MKKIFLLFLFAVCLQTVNAAYLENIPQTLIQPNGDTIHCFASGDEYYHWLHDADGFTIVQNPQTGYFVYAIQHEGKIIPSAHVAGTVNPRTIGLTPHLRISAQEWQARRKEMWTNIPTKISPKTDNWNHGEINNIVVFIRFADENNFTHSFADVNQMFNDSSSISTGSLYNYYQNISYHQLQIISHFYPEPDGDLILSYEDIYPKNYYRPYSETNPTGYSTDDDWERTDREMSLLARAIDYIADMVPADLNIDYNNDGYVDNVCFVIKGSVDGWNNLLWPHRWALYTQEAYIHNKRVFDYNFQLSDDPTYFSTATMCHEMFHSLGAPDLYHYSHDEFSPVGPWDVMASTSTPRPQNPGAWMKYRYGNWLPEIPEITESGTYTVHHLGGNSNEKVAYLIPSEIENEFFVIECRKKSDHFDLGIPESGLLIYHINTDFLGNADFDGDEILDEVYIYRQDGTLTDDGDIYEAAFKPSNQRTNFDYASNPQPFLSNGYISGIRIYDIVSHIDSITFSYLKPGDTIPVDTTGIAQYATSNFQIFPNPAKESITLNLPSLFLNGQITIYDAAGRCCAILSASHTQEKLSLNFLDKGLYLIKIIAPSGEILTRKLLKE